MPFYVLVLAFLLSTLAPARASTDFNEDDGGVEYCNFILHPGVAEVVEQLRKLKPGSMLRFKARRDYESYGIKAGQKVKLRLLRFDERKGLVILEDPLSIRVMQWTLDILPALSHGKIKYDPDMRLPKTGNLELHWSWRLFERDFERVVSRFINREIQHYRKAFKEKHPHILFLMELGFRFEPEVVVPSLSHIMTEIMARFQKLIDDGVVDRKDVLLPARPYSSADGQIIYVQWGKNPPEGYAPLMRLLDDAEFIEMTSSGFYPFGEQNNGLIKGRQVLFVHDLAHLSAFLKHPDYMKALRRSATALSRERFFSKRGNVSSALSRALFQATEMLVTIPKENLARLDAVLSLPEVESPDSGYRVSDVKRHLMSLSDEEFNRVYARVLAEYPKIVVPLGGAARDIVTRSIFGSGMPLLDDPEGLWVTLNYDHTRPNPEIGSRPAKAWELARLEVALMELRRFTPAQWVREILSPGLSMKRVPGAGLMIAKGSKLYRFYCESGFLTQRYGTNVLNGAIVCE